MATKKTQNEKTQTEFDADSLMEIIVGLPKEVRDELRVRGIPLPAYMPGDTETRTWGYRCRSCNQIGLEFVGSEFENVWGQQFERPNQSMRFIELMWVQPELTPDRIDKVNPVCQHCGEKLLQFQNRIRDDLVMHIKQFTESRDAAMKKMREMANERGYTKRDVIMVQDKETGETRRLNDTAPSRGEKATGFALHSEKPEYRQMRAEIDRAADELDLGGALADNLRGGR